MRRGRTADKAGQCRSGCLAGVGAALEPVSGACYLRPLGQGPHRLAVQDAALSRRKQGFESPWGYQPARSPLGSKKGSSGRRTRLEVCSRLRSGPSPTRTAGFSRSPRDCGQAPLERLSRTATIVHDSRPQLVCGSGHRLEDGRAVLLVVTSVGREAKGWVIRSGRVRRARAGLARRSGPPGAAPRHGPARSAGRCRAALP
jgi:hypothetical protein